MKKPQTVAADGVLKNKTHSPNLTERPQKSNTSKELARRDAAAMVKILDKMKSGWQPYEIVYESLKRLHGQPFEYYFREILSGRYRNDIE